MNFKRARQILGEEKKNLHEEIKQSCHLYRLCNENDYLAQLFSRQEKCRCLACGRSINYNCSKLHVTIYLKTTTITRNIKVCQLGRNLFLAEPQIRHYRELALANPFALDCFCVPKHYSKLYKVVVMFLVGIFFTFINVNIVVLSSLAVFDCNY